MSSGQVSGGGGGSSYYSLLSSITSQHTSVGNDKIPGNSDDLDNGGAGQGSVALLAGSNGLVVVYYGAAQIVSISSPSPTAGHSASGSVIGGTLVTINGLGFVAGTTVTIGN